MKRTFLPLFMFLFAACAPVSPTQTTAPATPIVTPTSSLGISLPPVEGAEPSAKIAAFYYPWYGSRATDGSWIHWDQSNHLPPQDIGSDSYPALSAYSSKDPQVVAQHMAWLRRAGVGVIISSWWGPGSNEDRNVPLVLEMAERYGIKVAFHIEPYNGRTAESIVNDVKYIYEKYGNSPAFFRSTQSSRYSPGDQPRGMFFIWLIEFKEFDQPVQSDYWLPAMDEIHALPQGALIIANTNQGSWVNASHFDGLYNYATLDLQQGGGFGWARSLPPNTLYVPSVIPGFSAKRIGYPADTYVPRNDGATFNDQWTAALGTGVEPALMTVTSFNEWHEGSMIEPAAVGANDGRGNNYADFGSLPPEGYLDLTREWIGKYLATQWGQMYRARITVTTTSDWTTLNVAGGGAWMRPERISASESATNAGMETGDRFVLMQSIGDASAGKQVEMTWDVLLSNLIAGDDLALQIDRGNIGFTQVTIYNYTGAAPVQIAIFKWGGVTTDRNSHTVKIPTADLMNPAP